MAALAAVKLHSEHDIVVVGGRCARIENSGVCVAGARTDTGEWVRGSAVKRARLRGGSGSQRTRNSISCLRERRFIGLRAQPGVMWVGGLLLVYVAVYRGSARNSRTVDGINIKAVDIQVVETKNQRHGQCASPTQEMRCSIVRDDAWGGWHDWVCETATQ